MDFTTPSISVTTAKHGGSSDLTFHWADYLVFALFLLCTALMGVFVSFLNRKKKTDAKDFLTGGGHMHYFPIALSMMASFLSAIFVISIPAEMYVYGTNYALLLVAYFTGFPIAAHVYLPVFHRLGLTSGYEYLEMRFNKAVRLCGTITFSVMMLLYSGVVLYTPSVALSQVSGMPISLAILSVGLVATFYTSLGGMKATVWNDAIQMGITTLCFILLIILGSIHVGGFGYALSNADEGGRLTIFKAATYNPDPFIRTTFWTQAVGGTFVNIVMYASSQNIIQKFLSTGSIREGQKAVWLSSFTTAMMMVFVIFIGCIIFAKYEFCDPIGSGRVKKIDQIVAFFVMEVMGHLHGLPGLFLAAAFSATLSTVSGGVNALVAVYLEDVILPLQRHIRGKELGVKFTKNLARGLAVFFGLATIAVAFLSGVMGKLVLQIALSVFGMVGGPLAGIISLGLFVPIANTWGALAGLFSSLGMTFWIGIGAVILRVPQRELPINITGCDFPGFNATLPPPTLAPEVDQLKIYQLSFMHYSLLAMIVVFVVGIPVSLITGGNPKEKREDSRLYYFFQDKICCCCPAGCRTACRCGVAEETEEIKYEETEEDAVMYTFSSGEKTHSSADEKKV